MPDLSDSTQYRKANNSLVITAGHVVIDQIIDTIDQVYPRTSLGGPSSYSSLTLTSLGYHNKAITKVGRDFPVEFAAFLSKYGGIDINTVRMESYKTTSYRIDRTYSPRRMWLIERCKPLSVLDFGEYLKSREGPQSHTLVLNPVAGEISLSLLDRISKEFDLVLVDSQGFVRKISSKTSEVSIKSGLDISSLSGVDILKADREELTGWTGVRDVDTSIREISKFVDTILLTSGPGEVDLFNNGRLIYRARPPAIESVDTTGAGDIMLACFAGRYSETNDLKKALAMSVCAASLAVKKLGIEKAILNKEEVISKAEEIRIMQT